VSAPLRFFVFGTAISEPGTLGGDTRILLELVRRWAAWGEIDATIVTSATRRETCLAYHLPPSVTYEICPETPGVWSLPGHLRSALQLDRLATRLDPGPDRPTTVVYSASDFLTDVLPAARLKRRFRRITWLASRFLFVPSPFKGWRRSYERGLSAPDPFLAVAGVYQRLAFSTIRRRADLFFITNETDRVHFTRRGVDSGRVLPVYGGVAFDEIASTPAQPLRYDGCFVGRISPQKGVLDLVDIWARVRARKPDARLALIGSGNARFEKELRDAVEARGLGDAIDLLGFLDGHEKHRVYKASRVFLHTSVHDNYGMAACEAMAAGVPAVLYDLPPLRIAYPQGCLRALRTDRQDFADAVLRLLDDRPTHERLSQEALAWARTQDWDLKAAKVLEFLRTSVAARAAADETP
jgi:glycosyltransferase involved in cell wall biosynthesis